MNRNAIVLFAIAALAAATTGLSCPVTFSRIRFVDPNDALPE